MAARTVAAPKPEEITVRLEGATPLLMHNVRMADPLNEYAVALRDITAKSKGRNATITQEEFAEQKSWLQFVGSLYWDDEIGVAMPGRNVLRSFIDGGAKMTLGTKLAEATISYDWNCRIDPWSDKFDSAEDIFAAGHRHVVMVKIPGSGSQVQSTRPRFDQWSITFTATIDTTVLTADDYVRCAESAGRFSGIGDGRKKGYGMGRYTVTRLK